jgi:hypothetical protein
MISELYLGALYAVTAALLILVLVLIALVWSSALWLKKHVRGAVAWNETTVETKLERK